MNQNYKKLQSALLALAVISTMGAMGMEEGAGGASGACSSAAEQGRPETRFKMEFRVQEEIIMGRIRLGSSVLTELIRKEVEELEAEYLLEKRDFDFDFVWRRQAIMREGIFFDWDTSNNLTLCSAQFLQKLVDTVVDKTKGSLSHSEKTASLALLDEVEGKLSQLIHQLRVEHQSGRRGNYRDVKKLMYEISAQIEYVRGELDQNMDSQNMGIRKRKISKQAKNQ